MDLTHEINEEVAAKMKIFTKVSFLLSLTYAMVEKVLFLDLIFEKELLMDLHVMRSPESENHIFSVWSVCMCVCVSVISITQNFSRDVKLNRIHLYHVKILLETFYKDR